MLWLVMEEVCPKLQAAYVVLFSDNSPTIGYPYIYGIGGIIMGDGKACIPTVFCLAWPDDVKELFHKGNITNLYV